MSEKNLVYEYEGIVNKLKKQIRGLENVKLSYEEDHARYTEEITNLCGQLDVLDAQVLELQKSLNAIMNNQWTQIELDAAKWRAQELKEIFDAK